MTTIIKEDSGSSIAGLILGLILAVALLIGGLYFYNAGGFTRYETNTTTVVPAPAPAVPPSMDVTTPTPAPAAPGVETHVQTQ